jgi:hypothetical protein
MLKVLNFEGPDQCLEQEWFGYDWSAIGVTVYRKWMDKSSFPSIS